MSVVVVVVLLLLTGGPICIQVGVNIVCALEPQVILDRVRVGPKLKEARRQGRKGGWEEMNEEEKRLKE
jgi:hypothetical protein